MRRRDFAKHGYTDDCDGCKALSAGMENSDLRAHSRQCRLRMEKILLEDESTKERVQRAWDRQYKNLENKLIESDKARAREAQSDEVDHDADPGAMPSVNDDLGGGMDKSHGFEPGQSARPRGALAGPSGSAAPRKLKVKRMT